MADNKTEKEALTKRKIFAFAIKIILGLSFFIIGFRISNSRFFEENPLFGIPYLAEVLISAVAAALGFHVVPLMVERVQDWFEAVVSATISRTIADFWEEQSKKVQQARKQQQKDKRSQKQKEIKEKYSKAFLLDTSVLIDGRILDIVKTGFVDKTLIIPQSVIDELHKISDNADSQKRQRGRRGLDIVKELKKRAKVVIFDNPFRARKSDVDSRLVSLAKQCRMILLTLDFNLNKVAEINGVKVLNINDLANALRTVMLPGESLKLEIVQEGKEKNQGVGYLPDGTMVVVKDAKKKVGEEVDVKVSKVIQTQAGKMIFCDLNNS